METNNPPDNRPGSGEPLTGSVGVPRAPRSYESSVDRLRKLPEAFSVEQLCLLANLEKTVALKYVNRWSDAGLLLLAGPRVGFYANLVRAPQLAKETGWLEAALLHVYPSAVIVGASVLNPAGWITQHPHQVQIAAPWPANRSKVNGFDVTPRGKGWFVAVHPYIQAPVGGGGIRSLSPAMALADMFGQKDSWHPDEDDIEIPEEEVDAVIEAFAALGVPIPEALEEVLSQAKPASLDRGQHRG